MSPVYKRPTEGGLGAFCFLPLAFALEGSLGLRFLGLELWLDSFALGFLVWEAFGREKSCREIAEGKRMAKEVLIESLHRELYHRP
jgi:hypothetical protein